MKALAQRYGDDPRLGYVDIGGYGKYGEWHTDGEGANGNPASIGRIIRAVHDSFPKQHVLINAMNTEGTRQALALDPTIGVRMDCLGARRLLLPLRPHRGAGSAVEDGTRDDRVVPRRGRPARSPVPRR